MSSTSYNRQFLTIDFRLLDDPAYVAFMRSPAYPIYILLRRYIWRGFDKLHPVGPVNELYRQGYLATSVNRALLAKKLGLRNVATVSRRITELIDLGVMRIFRTGRENIFILGTWEDRSQARDRSYLIEIFIVDQIFGADQFEQLRLGDTSLSEVTRPVAPGVTRPVTPGVTRPVTPGVTRPVTPGVTPPVTPGVTPPVTPEVTPESPNNKEVNRETNNKIQGFFEPAERKEPDDDVIYVTF